MKILFVDGTKGFSPDRLDKQPTGGILTSLTLIPRYLADQGHEVYVKSVFNKTVKVKGVQYLGFSDSVSPLDVVVFNRNTISHGAVKQAELTGARIVWWLHDIVDHRYLIDSAFSSINNIVALSKYCVDTYSEFYGLNRNKFAVIPNGIERNKFFPGDYKRRDKNLFVFASAPIKGMKPLAFTFNNIKRHVPQAKLQIFGSQSLHDLENDAIVGYWIDELKKEGAEIVGPVSQDDLADVFRKAWALLMPNSYPEICSNIILQAKACGLPVVTSPIGSAPEFLEDGYDGLLTKSFPHDMYFWWAEFTKRAVQLSVNNDLHKRISVNAQKSSRTWENIGRTWERYLKEVVLARAPMEQGVPSGV